MIINKQTQEDIDSAYHNSLNQLGNVTTAAFQDLELSDDKRYKLEEINPKLIFEPILKKLNGNSLLAYQIIAEYVVLLARESRAYGLDNLMKKLLEFLAINHACKKEIILSSRCRLKNLKPSHSKQYKQALKDLQLDDE